VLNPQSYELALRIAADQLRGVDLRQQCLRAGATLREREGRQEVVVRFLGRSAVITLPEMAGRYDDDGGMSIQERILLLHYLLRATQRPVKGPWIDFRQLPGGQAYYPTFLKRTTAILIRAFGQCPELLLEASRVLEGVPLEGFGDVGVLIPALPRVPLAIILWKAEGEFGPEAKVLFDVSVSEYLSTEDVVMLAQEVALRLSRATQTGGR